MAEQENHVPGAPDGTNGRRNGRGWKGLTEAGRQKLREAAFRNKPWRYSTGPRTAEGKAKSALNAKKRHRGIPIREQRRPIRAADGLLAVRVNQVFDCQSQRLETKRRDRL